MANTEILELQITDNALQAAGGLERLEGVLGRIRNLLSGNFGLNRINRQLQQFQQTLSGITDADVGRMNSLADALERVSNATAGLRNMNLGGLGRAMRQASQAAQMTTPQTAPTQGNTGLIPTVTPDAARTVGEMQTQLSVMNQAGAAASAAAGSLVSLAESEYQIVDASGAADGAIESTVHEMDSMTETATRTSGAMSALHNVLGHIRNGFATLQGRIHDGVAGFRSFLGSIARVAKYRMIRAALKAITQGFKEGVSNLYQYSRLMGTSFYQAMDKLATANLKLKNSLGAMVGPLIQALAPALQTIINLAIAAANAINQLIAVFSGAAGWTQAIDYATTWGDSLSNAAGGASKKMKNLLADWDELNIIQQESGGGGGGSSGPDYSQMFQEAEFAPWVRWIQEHLQLIKDLVIAIGVGFLAWKIAHMFTDNLKTVWGFALAIAGAFVLVKSTIEAFTNGVSFDTFFGQLIGAIALTAGLGLMFGKVGAAIGLIVSGITMAVTGFYDQLQNGVDWENLTTLITGCGLAVAGLALMFGTTGAAIGLVIAGVLAIINPMKEWIETGNIATESLVQLSIGIAAVGVGIALLTGSWIPLAVAAVGIAVAWVVAKWDWLCENVFNPIGDFFAGIWDSIVLWWNTDVKPKIDAVVAWVDTNVVQPVSQFFTNMTAWIMATAHLIGQCWDNLWRNVVEPVVTWIDENIIQPVAGFFTALWGTIMGDEENNLGIWWTNLWQTTIYPIVTWIDENITQPIAGFFSALWGTITGDDENNMGIWWNNFWENTILPKVQWVNDNITTPISEFFTALWGSITGDEDNNLGTWWTNFWENSILPKVEWIKTNITEPIASFFSNLWNTFTDSEIVQQAVAWWNGLWGEDGTFASVINTIDTTIIQPISGFFSNLWTSIMGDEENGIGAWWNSLWNDTFLPIVTTIKEKITDPIAELFSNAATAIRSAWNGIVNFFIGIVNGLIDCINALINALNSVHFTIPAWGFDIPLTGVHVGMDEVTIGISGIGLIEKIPFVEERAEGGFVNAGQMFVARENGLTEMVGQIGNKTAVANNDQIVAGIASGVADGQAEQNALLRQNNELMRRLLMKELVAKIVPSSGLAKTVKRSEEMRLRNEGV